EQVAVVTSIEVTVLLNVAANMFITWGDYLQGLTTRERLLWFGPLLIAFQLLTPTIPLKLVGASLLSRWLPVSPLAIVALFELIAVVVNYCAADLLFSRIFAGFLHRLAARPQQRPVTSQSAPGRVMDLVKAAVIACRPKHWLLKNVLVLGPLVFMP